MLLSEKIETINQTSMFKEEVFDPYGNSITIYYTKEEWPDGYNILFNFWFPQLERHSPWFGDNHEYGNPERVFEIAPQFAKSLSVIFSQFKVEDRLNNFNTIYSNFSEIFSI